MTVFVVVAPHDYQSAEIVGVYTDRRLAENAKRNAENDGRREGSYIFICEITLEG